MGYLVLYLAVTVAGYFIGAKLKKSGIEVPWAGKMQTLVIIMLVFLMGSRIGANEEIVASLDTIGLVSLAFTLIIMAATCIAFSVVRRLMGFDRYGIRWADPAGRAAPSKGASHTNGIDSSNGTGRAETEDAADEKQGGSGVNSLTILIVVFVAIGIACGYLFLPEAFMALTGTLLTITLCILLVLIGIDIGTEGTLMQNFRSAGWRVVVFPFVSMAAMLVGSALASLVLPMGLQDAVCVGSGLGWYSLAPAMLASYSTEVSAISFMHNVFREIIGVLLIPLAARRLGYIESYSLPGSPSMDVCLPVIERATSGDVAVYSFINGAVLSAAVPILVSVFMSV